MIVHKWRFQSQVVYCLPKISQAVQPAAQRQPTVSAVQAGNVPGADGGSIGGTIGGVGIVGGTVGGVLGEGVVDGGTTGVCTGVGVT